MKSFFQLKGNSFQRKHEHLQLHFLLSNSDLFAMKQCSFQNKLQNTSLGILGD